MIQKIAADSTVQSIFIRTLPYLFDIAYDSSGHLRYIFVLLQFQRSRFVCLLFFVCVAIAHMSKCFRMLPSKLTLSSYGSLSLPSRTCISIVGIDGNV